MKEQLRLARPFLALLAVFVVGRWMLGVFGVPYVRGHHVFSIVILTNLAAAFYAMFCRRWLGVSILRAALLGAGFGVAAQAAIFAATMASYAFGLQTYFNDPVALNVTRLGDPAVAVPLSHALPVRLGGLIGGPLFCSVSAALGWVMGALLPEGPPGRS